MKRPQPYILTLIVLSWAAFCFGDAPVKQTVVAGHSITLTSASPATWLIPNRDTVKNSKSATVLYTSPGVRLITVTPGPDIELTVLAATPTPQPTTSPTTKPIPPPVIVPTPPASVDPRPIIKVADGFKGPLKLASNTRYVSAVPGASVRGDIGILIGDGITNTSVESLDCIGNGARGDGIRMVAKRCSGITFTDCSWRNFTASITSQNLAMDGPVSDYNRNLRFLRCRFLDEQGKGHKEGHCAFTANLDGLRFEECFFQGAGWSKSVREIWVHGDYDQHGNRNDVFLRNIFYQCESVGVQARGSLNHDTDPDDGTPGPVIDGNLIADCQIGIMVNGARAEVRDNIIQVGHYTTINEKSGQGGIYASVGKLKMTGNVRVNGPTGAIGKTGSRINPAFFNNPRPYKDADSSGKLLRWEWHGPTSTIENAGNVDRLNLTPDFTDLMARARSGERVGPLIDIARARLN